MSFIMIRKSGIDDKALLDLVECLKKRKNGTYDTFPKLNTMDLRDNYIKTDGVRAILNLGAPLL